MASVFHIVNATGREAAWASTLMERQAFSAPWAKVSREHPDHLETQVDWALKEGVTRLVVWGGDGTFHRVVRALWKRQALGRMELAFVPAGTCNDLSRQLNLSKYFWKRWEAETPDASRLVELSLGRMKWQTAQGTAEDVVLNNAGFGRTRQSFEQGHGALGVIGAFQPLRAQLAAPGVSGHGLYFMGLVCLSPFFSGGLFFERMPVAARDALRVYLVPAQSKFRLALRFLFGRLGRPMADAKITALSVKSITLEFETPVWPQADGEPPPTEGTRRLEFELLPEKARVWCPA